MKSTIVAATLLASVSSVAAQKPDRFSLVVASNNNDLNARNVNATGSQLWIGKPTSSSCPDEVQPNCPAGDFTGFQGGDGGLTMNVEVPGGQQVYVTPQGLIKFSQAHSNAVDAGSNLNGFSYQSGVQAGFGALHYANGGISGFLACQALDGTPNAYTIQANNVSFVGEVPAGCQTVQLLVPENAPLANASAWQYN